MLEGEPKEAEEKEEIVVKVILKGGCDVFFCHQYSSLTKAGRGDAAEPVEGRGTSVGITQLRDFAIQWVRTDAVEPWVSQNRAGASWAAAATAARIFLRGRG